MSYGISPAGSAQPVQPVDESWAEGVEFDPAAGSGFIPSGELLAWLAAHSRGVYDNMRQQMMGAEQRRELQKDLKDLKSRAEDVQALGTSAAVYQLDQAVSAVVAKYAGTPLEARVNKLLGERATELAGYRAINTAHDAAVQAGTPEQAVDALRSKLDESVNHAVTRADSFKTAIDALSDDLSTEDQLAMIRIQELNSQANQATQLTSNLLASQNQTASSVVMNIKA